MRAILVDWIVHVHYNLKCKIETLYLTIWIIDTYLSNKKIQRSQLQLLGIASLLISCKINEICYPNILNFVKLTDYAFQKIELLEMEKDILHVLDFNLCVPTSIEFFQILSKLFELNEIQINFGKYFLESVLIDYDMIYFSPSIIAFSSIYIS